MFKKYCIDLLKKYSPKFYIYIYIYTYKLVLLMNEKKRYTSTDTYFLLPPLPLSDAGMEHITMNRKSKQAALTADQPSPLRKVM